MPDKNIVIALDGTPGEATALITRSRKVSFIPADSEQTVSVRFFGRTTPFSDWASTSKTGTKGRALTGKVKSDASGQFTYQAKSTPSSGPLVRRPRPIANPQLIVDGGR